MEGCYIPFLPLPMPLELELTWLGGFLDGIENSKSCKSTFSTIFRKSSNSHIP